MTPYIIIGFLIFLAALYIRSMYRDNLWSRGIFPINLSFSESNLMEAYIAVAAVILRNDYVHVKEKIKYMSKYFDQYFPDSNYDFMSSLKFSFETPIEEETVGEWINKNIKSQTQKSQIIYFITGLSIIDGRINQREFRFIENLAKSIGMSQVQFDSIMSMYQANYKQSQEDKKPIRKPSLAETCYSILEIPNKSNKLAVKTAYRKLVKVYHPDRHTKSSPTDKKVARERFIKIQKAYDYLNQL